MWICLNKAFLSVVYKECAEDELLVRARCANHIKNVFPKARVKKSYGTDYAFRARIKRAEVIAAMTAEIEAIGYGNFKDSVHDRPLHDAYMGVWGVMSHLQPHKPYACAPGRGKGRQPALTGFGDPWSGYDYNMVGLDDCNEPV